MKSGLFLEQAVEILEKSMIERALQATGANQSEAAKMLGIHRNTLQRKMVAYDIDGQAAAPQACRRARVARWFAGRAKLRRRLCS